MDECDTRHPSGGTIRVPTIEDGITRIFATVMDLAPTILELAGLPHPAATYQDRPVVPMHGKNMLPFILGEEARIHSHDHIHGWETAGQGALCNGNYKIVFISKPKGPERWQLYNHALDPGEVQDLSQQPEYEEKMKQLLGCREQSVLECGIVPLASELGRFMEATGEQMHEGLWIEYEYWMDVARERPEEFVRKVPRFTSKPM